MSDQMPKRGWFARNESDPNQQRIAGWLANGGGWVVTAAVVLVFGLALVLGFV